jgi:hypothetical protein
MASRSWLLGPEDHATSRLAIYGRWCDRFAADLGPVKAVRVKSFVVHHELQTTAVEAVRAVEEQAADLDPGRRDEIRGMVAPGFLASLEDAPMVSAAVVMHSETSSDALATAAFRVGMAVSGEGDRLALASDTPWGRLVLTFAEVEQGDIKRSRSEIVNRLTVARAEALGTLTGFVVELISGRSDLSVIDRKQRVREVIEGLRRRMGYGVLAYAGLFNRDGMLEVPDNPALFFMDDGLRRTGSPVFQDPVSRSAVSASERMSQRYRLAGREMADVAVPIMRGRNRLGVLRLGVFQIDTSDE